MKTSQINKLTTNQRFFYDLLLSRSYVSSTVKIKTLAQIMAALEEQFVSHPNGFPKHFGADVKDQTELGGLSWRELISIGRDSFNDGFNKLGITYESEEEFDAVKDDQNEFQGKFYCRVITRYKKRKYYYRNNIFVDSVIETYKQSLNDPASDESSNQELALAE